MIYRKTDILKARTTNGLSKRQTKKLFKELDNANAKRPYAGHIVHCLRDLEVEWHYLFDPMFGLNSRTGYIIRSPKDVTYILEKSSPIYPYAHKYGEVIRERIKSIQKDAPDEDIILQLFDREPTIVPLSDISKNDKTVFLDPYEIFESELYKTYIELRKLVEFVRLIWDGQTTNSDYRLKKIAEQPVIMTYFLKLSAISDIHSKKRNIMVNSSNDWVKDVFKPLKLINQALQLTEIQPDDKDIPRLVRQDNSGHPINAIFGWSPHEPLTDIAPTDDVSATDILHMDVWIPHIVREINAITNIHSD